MYTCVAFVSTYHAMAFFALSNPQWLAVILAITFEVGQAVVLFSILTSSNNKAVMPWTLMGILTAVQVLGNVFSTYKYMVVNNMDQIQYFTKSILFFVQNPNPEYNYVIISYITGAILPVVALLMTSMVSRTIHEQSAKNTTPEVVVSDEPPVENATPEEQVEETAKPTRIVYD